MLNRAASITRRCMIVLITIIAWLALSNHCLLGSNLDSGKAEQPPEASGCPMHSAPVKQKPAVKTPCCKEIRALVAKCVTASPAAMRLIGSREYTAAIFLRPLRVALEVDGLDTGPPGCPSFAESVLQESMLSHAPPLS